MAYCPHPPAHSRVLLTAYPLELRNTASPDGLTLFRTCELTGLFKPHVGGNNGTMEGALATTRPIVRTAIVRSSRWPTRSVGVGLGLFSVILFSAY